MSFILDALRKSESERQQDSRPNIARLPDAVPPRRVPTWAIGTIAVLGLGLLALSAAWWRTSRPDPAPAADTPSAALAPSDRSARTPLPIPPAVEDRRARAAPQPESSGISLQTAAAAARRAAIREAPKSETTPAEPSGEVESADSPAVDSLLPSYATVAAELGLPALRLELHAYHDDPGSRFVFINGARYREGDSLPDGLRLVEINPRGAVLAARGRQALLGQE